jgi:hypothetical protein
MEEAARRIAGGLIGAVAAAAANAGACPARPLGVLFSGGVDSTALLAVCLRLGRVVQVDPTEPKLKAPGTKRLKLKYDGPLSNFAFKFNLRRYTSASPSWPSPLRTPPRRRQGLTLVHLSAQRNCLLSDRGCI